MVELNSLSELQNKALTLIEDKLHYVVRFRGNKHIVTRNSVRDHIRGLNQLINSIIPEGTMPKVIQKLIDELRIAAVLHDMGEILGEVSTLEEVINQEAIRDGLKKEFEFKVFKVFARLAVKAVRRERPEIFELTYQSLMEEIHVPLKLTRKLVNKLDALLAITDLESECDMAYVELEELYYQVENGKSISNLIFKLIDKLEGNRYFIDNAVLQEQLSTSKFEEVHKMNSKLYSDILNTKVPVDYSERDNKYLGIIKDKIRTELLKVFSDYESILKSNNLKVSMVPTNSLDPYNVPVYTID